MTNDEFTAWLSRVGLTKAQAAKALGVSASYVTLLTQGARPITDSIAETCDGIEHTPPAVPAPLDQRTTALERSVRALQQRVDELGAAFEGAGLQLRQAPIPMTDEEAEEAELKLLKAQLLEQMNRAAKAAPGALTDDEREEAERARRMIAKARTLAAGEPWE